MISKMLMFLFLIQSTGFSQLKSLQSMSSNYFRIQYEKTLPSEEVRSLTLDADKIYERYRTKFGYGFYGKKNLIILATSGRFRYESGSKIFDDGDFKNDNLYIVLRLNKDQNENLKNVLSRVISRALLDQLPTCPPWFAEAYSLYAGDAIEKFGKPVQLNISSLADLGEDYARSSDKRGLKDLYAKLGSTIEHFINKYGENKVDVVVKNLREGKLFEKVVPAIFNESMDDIERSWIRDLKNPE
ncbi:MAG: hypothetical protein HY964_04950 [Ignavibacteriales bacterium]|nr:hypothetical protein [Ignavibacteriales bacterium]